MILDANVLYKISEKIYNKTVESERKFIDYVSCKVGMTSAFRLLQERGSPWLKSRVLFADHQAIVLNKPPNFVCQLRRPTAEVSSKPEVPCSKSLTLVMQ